MPTTGRWMDQYGWIWHRTNANPEIDYVDWALPMELIWFEDYLALAEILNFSRAAELRHVTQPAFSRRIRALEGWVGAALFTRTTHGVALTPAGEHFHSQAEVLTRALHQLRRDTSEVSGRRGKPLSIAATHALSFTFFPKWVRGNERVLALGNLSLISDSMQSCEQIMLRGDVQFLLCHHHKDASSRIYSSQSRASWSASTPWFRSARLPETALRGGGFMAASR